MTGLEILSFGLLQNTHLITIQELLLKSLKHKKKINNTIYSKQVDNIGLYE